jgi:5'-nucleotidase
VIRGFNGIVPVKSLSKKWKRVELLRIFGVAKADARANPPSSLFACRSALFHFFDRLQLRKPQSRAIAASVAYGIPAMKFLLSNDDGIDAPGLAALHEAAAVRGDAVVVAPAGPQSGKSHAITWESPVRLEPRRPGWHAVHGTPADCARLGLLRVAPDAQWVLSGINHGGNLGADVYYSGTVAAVREAALHGWPGIAFSHYLKKLPIDWPRVTRWTHRVLDDLLARPVPAGGFYNVNFPHLTPDAPEPGIVFCPLDPNPLPLSYRHEEEEFHVYDGEYSTRRRTPGADVDRCFSGSITVTEMRLF